MKSTLCEDAITAMVYPYAQGILGARSMYSKSLGQGEGPGSTCR